MNKIDISAGFTGWSSYGYASIIGTLKGAALVNGFYCCTVFIWVSSWITSWTFFWPTSLSGTFEGTAGGFDFLNISAWVFNASLCQFPNLTRNIAGAVFWSAYMRSFAV